MIRRYAAVILYAALALGLAGCSRLPFSGASPKAVFEAEFLTPYEKVIVRAHGGSTFSRSETWLAFTSREPVQLKDRDQYLPANPDPARKYFLGVDGKEAVTLKNLNLRCLTREESSGGRTRVVRWLLYDPERGAYWFRSWTPK